MDPIDHRILELCRDALRPLKPLRTEVATGSLYRHANRLIELGHLRKQRGLYQTTSTGLRLLVEALSQRPFDALERLYRPLTLVPTAVHRAVITLILAAIVARQHASRADRHPFFVIFGATLRWKTSLALFICHMLGLDPASLIVDCAAEAGKSLWVRRGAAGTLVFKRSLLDAPFLCLDEALSADASVRGAIGIFLTGRLAMPVENEQVTVRPVPLLLLNPRIRNTLEDRIGLSSPQIRRAIVANVDAVAMPDLATMGEHALAAAQAARPLRLGAPRVDCRPYHRAIVELTRATIRPEAHDRVDVEVVLNLCAGMTAFVPEPAEAIAEVGYALGLVAETMGWMASRWIDAVAGFTLDARPARCDSSEALAIPAPVHAQANEPEDREAERIRPLSLEVPRPAARPAVPDLKLSDALRARLIWFAVDTRQSLESGLTLLLNFYLQWRRNKATLWTLHTILQLAEQLEITEVEVEALHGYLQARTALARHNCTFEDVPQALRVLELLAELPESWDWAQARLAVQGVASFVRAGISADQVDAILQHHDRLIELGLDEAIAETIAEALSDDRVTADQRGAVLREMAAIAGERLDRDGLERERQALQNDVTALTAERARLSRVGKGLKTLVRRRDQEVQAAQQRKLVIDAEAATATAELGALRAFRALVQRKPGAVETFCVDLERLVRWLRSGGRPDPAQTTQLMTTWLQTLATYLSELVAEARVTQPGP